MATGIALRAVQDPEDLSRANPLIRTTFCTALLYRRSRESGYSAGSLWRIKTFRLLGAQKRTRTSTVLPAAT